jgi:hypothetical protein
MDAAMTEFGASFDVLGLDIEELPEAAIVRGGTRGTVYDLNLARLRWGITEAIARGSTPRIRLHIGQPIEADTVVASSDMPLPRLARITMRRAIRFAPWRQDAGPQTQRLVAEALPVLATDTSVLDVVLQAFEDSIAVDLGVPPADV